MEGTFSSHEAAEEVAAAEEYGGERSGRPLLYCEGRRAVVNDPQYAVLRRSNVVRLPIAFILFQILER